VQREVHDIAGIIAVYQIIVSSGIYDSLLDHGQQLISRCRNSCLVLEVARLIIAYCAIARHSESLLLCNCIYSIKIEKALLIVPRLAVLC
jgi:hypothetical protein